MAPQFNPQVRIRNEADESVFPYSAFKSVTNPEGYRGSISPDKVANEPFDSRNILLKISPDIHFWVDFLLLMVGILYLSNTSNDSHVGSDETPKLADNDCL